MKSTPWLFVLSLLFPLSASAAPLILLDSGHEPSRPGAIGVCGKTEVEYNDALTAAVAAALGATKAFDVALTRKAGVEVSLSVDGELFLNEAHRANWRDNPRLYERASLGNRLQAAVLLSVHHDSTIEAFQEKALKACPGGKDGKRLTASFRKRGWRTGFSLFVHRGEDPARFEASVKIARAIAARFLAMGRTPSTHHQDPKDCGSCRLVDAKLGIYEKNLAVLRASDMPGVLIEAGLIVDVADEKAVNNDRFRRRTARAIAEGLTAAGY